MWENLFKKGREGWQELGFSIQFMRKLKKKSGVRHNKKMISFLQTCEVENPIELSDHLQKVYGSFDDFITRVQGLDQIS